MDTFHARGQDLVPAVKTSLAVMIQNRLIIGAQKLKQIPCRVTNKGVFPHNQGKTAPGVAGRMQELSGYSHRIR
ncbi:hypothetical protein SDC9_145195 [bioreactor metagenome]|uniref:Uncharacterized protein n=1 Tax=bioreactor metagenome TaxID=1076179 RepID=A0A645E7U4_9ZZZZ